MDKNKSNNSNNHFVLVTYESANPISKLPTFHLTLKQPYEISEAEGELTYSESQNYQVAVSWFKLKFTFFKVNALNHYTALILLDYYFISSGINSTLLFEESAIKSFLQLWLNLHFLYEDIHLVTSI